MSLEDLKLPYPGLRPFEEADGPIFFGRQTQIAVLLRRLETYRFVAVIGSSGSGKSSLVKAGLLPAIKRGFLFEKAKWLSIVIRPGGDPYRRLADELLKLRPQVDAGSATGEFEKSFRKTLRLTNIGLVKALSTLGLDPETHFLIVIDQFEELFSFRSAMPISEDYASRDEASAFVSMLLSAFQDKSAKIWVLLTMRSDFIGNCEAFLMLPENVSKSQFLVPRLESRQMEEAIIRPGQVTGAAFKPFAVPSELANLIINEAGDQPDQLPLMQHALMRTWKKAVALSESDGSPVLLTESNYEAAGRIKNALSRDADAAWHSLEEDDRLSEICRRMFMLLCDVLPGGRVVRRRPRIREVRKITGASEEQIKTILQLFQQDDRNFLRPRTNGTFDDNAILDITHEALFRRWNQIERWIQRESESAANYRELLAGAEKQQRSPDYRLNDLDTQRLDLWERTEKPTAMWAERYGGKFRDAVKFLGLCRKNLLSLEERRKRKVKRRILVVLTFLLTLGVVLGYFAYILHNKNSQLNEKNSELNRKNSQLNEIVRQQQNALELQQEQSRHLLDNADRIMQKRGPISHFNALRLAARSLRVYRSNSDSQRLLCRLMLENRWCLPTTATLTSDIDVDKYVLAATLLSNKTTLVVVTQEGTLLKWDGYMLNRTSLPTLKEDGIGLRGEAQPKGILPKLGEAFFSDDARYLITVPFALPTTTTSSDTKAQVYYDFEGTGDYRPLQPILLWGSAVAIHNLSWSPRDEFLVVSTIDWQKQYQNKSQLFENKASAIQPTDLFDKLEISAACFSSDGKQLFTSIPGVKATSPSQVDLISGNQTTKIMKWDISYENSRPKIMQDPASFDFGDYSRPVNLSCNADGTYLAALAWNSPVTVLETRTNQVKSFYAPDGGPIMRVSFCPSKEKDAHDLMMLATTDRVGFWKFTELNRMKGNSYALGEPWCEPIVFQGMAIANFLDNGTKVILVSGGSFRSYESARAWELPINERCCKLEDHSSFAKDPAPDWLLDVANVLTGSGREAEGETEDRPNSIRDIYQHNAAISKTGNEVYEILWEKFHPAD